MYASKVPIYQAQQIREFERLAQERFEVSGKTLMQRAGTIAFEFLARRWPQAQKIEVVCGSGNNGGDGYVLARVARERGLKVTVWQIGKQENLKEEAKEALLACQQAKIPINTLDNNYIFSDADLIVDAICGIGLHADLREDTIAIIKNIQQSKVPILSIDIPTGVDADTGHILGAAIHATATITFIGLKLGLLTGGGVACTGELVLSDLQLPADLFTAVAPIAEKIHLSAFSSYLKPRPRDWHKGLSGHVLVIGGDAGYSGAARMAAEAALRVGAGLVSVATKPENAPLMNINCPEIMCHAVSSTKELQPLIEKADVIVLGPGLGQSKWAKTLCEKCFMSNLPLIVDADGLNILSQEQKTYDHWVLTPHPGEAGRLIGKTPQVIQADRLSAIKEINKKYGGVCVLKGAGSLIQAPNTLVGLCDKGNPGMASAGMGDILSGVIGGLVAQSIPLGDAAKLGVCLHAMAGDLAAKDGERGMLAMDLMPYIRRLANYSNYP